jgi:2-haloacid dehalogenase
MGAVSFGFKGVWINRARLPDEYADLAPLRQLPDLADLPSLDL